MRAALLVLAVASLAAVSAGTVGAALPANLPAAASPVAAPPPSGGASGTAMAAATQLLPSTESGLLSLAESGIEAARRYWWNPALGWYDQRLERSWDPSKPLARLWDAYPLFEAIDAVAIASPTPAHLAAVRAFADKAEQYYDPDLEPIGGYTWYIDTTNPHEHAYFDDNGWWELGFLDAYRATGSSRYLFDAEKAFAFIAEAGWNPNGGGVWWDNRHLKITAEPLAAEIYGGLALYQFTHDPTYLETAEQFLDWANASSWNQRLQLYSRNSDDPTVLDYVEGMMIGAHLELCQITGEQGYCRQAAQLAAASVAHFGTDISWTPAADAIYLRFLLDLYEQDGNSRWYQVVYDNAVRAFTEARAADGLFLGRWNGTQYAVGLLQPQAATISLFAWLAAANAPAAASESAEGAVDDVELPISVSPKALSFPASTLDQPRNGVLTVTNTATAAVTVTAAALGPLTRSEMNATFAVANGCPSGPLLPGQRCQLDVTFTPSNLARATIALTVETTTAAGTGLPVEVSLEGTTARPDLTEVAAPLRRAAPRSRPAWATTERSSRQQLRPPPAPAPPGLWLADHSLAHRRMIAVVPSRPPANAGIAPA